MVMPGMLLELRMRRVRCLKASRRSISPSHLESLVERVKERAKKQEKEKEGRDKGSESGRRRKAGRKREEAKSQRGIK